MTDCISEHFGERLAAIRNALNLKQATIGNALGCSNGAYSLYERNKREPTLSVLLNLCGKFGVSIDYLLGCYAPLPFIFAERLKTIIDRHPEKSLKEFVSLVHLDEASVNLLLSGKCYPNAKVFQELCRYFDCPADFLLGLSDISSTTVVTTIERSEYARTPFSDLTDKQYHDLQKINNLSGESIDEILDLIDFKLQKEEKNTKLASKQEA